MISLNITLLTSSTSALSLPSRVICAVSIILSVLSLSFAMILTRENQGSERIIVGDSFILIVDDADDDIPLSNFGDPLMEATVTMARRHALSSSPFCGVFQTVSLSGGKPPALIASY